MPTFHYAWCIPPQLPCCLQGCVSGSISPLQGEKWYLQAVPSPPQADHSGLGKDWYAKEGSARILTLLKVLPALLLRAGKEFETWSSPTEPMQG